MIKLNRQIPVLGSELSLLERLQRSQAAGQTQRGRNGQGPTLFRVAATELRGPRMKSLLESHCSSWKTVLVCHDNNGLPLTPQEIRNSGIEEAIKQAFTGSGSTGTFLGTNIVTIELTNNYHSSMVDASALATAKTALFNGKIVIIALNRSAKISAAELSQILAKDLGAQNLTLQ